MKKQILSLFLALAMLVSLVPTTVVTTDAKTVQQTFVINPGATSRYAPRLNGWDYEAWTDMRQVDNHPVSSQSSTMTVYTDGGFSVEWNNTYNTLFRTGRKFNPYPAVSTFTSPAGVASMRYDVHDFWSGSGATYMCIYGWTNGTTGNNTTGDSIIEWYIIDGWRNWHPGRASGGTYQNHGTTVINGNTYDVISAWRINQPWVGPGSNGTFLQLFNIRRDSQITGETNRSQGTIDVAAHFQSWLDLGIINNPQGSERSALTSSSRIYEISFTLEGYGGQPGGSRGRGLVDQLCLRYTGQTVALCTQGAAGCPNCGGAALPVCGVDGFVCGASSCVSCNPPKPECKCPPLATPVNLYTMEATPQMVEALNSGGASVGGFQRAGEGSIPVFGLISAQGSGPGITVSGRTADWHSADVLLGDLNLAESGLYRITVEGQSSAPLQLTFPLEDDPWNTNITTGTTTSVSMEFSGAPVAGQDTRRIRIRTGDTADYSIFRVRVDQIRECCNTCATNCTCSAPACSCPSRNLYTMPTITEQIAATLTSGAESAAGLQRSGEETQPLFTQSGTGLQIGNRGASWHAVDVLLAPLNLSSFNTYKITVTGNGGAAPLQLLFPLDDDPWEFGNVTGTATSVSMDFTGAAVAGQTDHRIRINTNDTEHFTISSITIEGVVCCNVCTTACTCGGPPQTTPTTPTTTPSTPPTTPPTSDPSTTPTTEPSTVPTTTPTTEPTTGSLPTPPTTEPTTVPSTTPTSEYSTPPPTTNSSTAHTTPTTAPTTASTTPTTAPTANCNRCDSEGECYLLGDIDNNGLIEIGDALQILRFVVGLSSDIDPVNNRKAWCAAMISANAPFEGKKPEIEDALQILRRVVGLSSSQRIGTRV